MNFFTAEMRKLATLRSLVLLGLLGAAIPPALSAMNAAGVAAAWKAGHPETVTSDLGSIGLQEALLGSAAFAAFGALAAGSEHRTLPPGLGGGRQATTTALAVPRRSTALGMKLLAIITVVTASAMLSCWLSIVLAHHFLAPFGPRLTWRRWELGARAVLYITLAALQGFGLCVLLRNTIIPLVCLVANSTVLSVGYLLTHLTRYAWYLPDTVGTLLIRSHAPGQPSASVGAFGMLIWTAALLAVAGAVEHRRDA